MEPAGRAPTRTRSPWPWPPAGGRAARIAARGEQGGAGAAAPDLPLLEGGNGAVLLAGLGLAHDAEVIEQVGGAPAAVDAVGAAAPGTLVVAADCSRSAGAAAALVGDGGRGEITPAGRVTRSLPLRVRGPRRRGPRGRRSAPATRACGHGPRSRLRSWRASPSPRRSRGPGRSPVLRGGSAGPPHARRKARISRPEKDPVSSVNTMRAAPPRDPVTLDCLWARMFARAFRVEIIWPWAETRVPAAVVLMIRC